MNAHKKCPVLTGDPGKNLNEDVLLRTRPPVVKRIGRETHVSEIIKQLLAMWGIDPESEADNG